MDAVLNDFHFLRPAWLLALLPCIALVIWLRRARASGSAWQGLIDPALLRVLLLPAPGPSSSVAPWLLLCAWTLAVLALAGPAWERLPEPVHRRQDALVIALDLGASMGAQDLQPSRLERVRFKLRDILERRREGLTALIVYAGDAHVVTPLTDDGRTLISMLPALSPEIMPVQGNDLPGAVRKAGELLARAGITRGRLLVATDAFPESQHETVARQLNEFGLSLSLLGVGTAAGAPVPLAGGGFLREKNGAIYVPGVDFDALSRGADVAGGVYSPLRIDDGDIRALLPDEPFADLTPASGSARVFDQWRDRGTWLALALLPLASLAFRRGWLLLLPLALVLPVPQAHALEWPDLWLRKDQQGAVALEQKDPARAVELFRSPEWRANAQYQAGDFAGAAESLAGIETADAHYNRGNALARGGKLEEALAAYDEALARDPQMDDAVANRKLVEDLLRRQQQAPRPQDADSQDQQERNGEQSGQAQGQGQQDNGGAMQDEQRRQGGPETEQEQEQEPDAQTDRDASGERAQAEREPAKAAEAPEPNAEPAAKEMTARPDERGQSDPADTADAGEEAQSGKRPENARASPAEALSQQERQQALEQWLRQVPDEPGELLRRKFEYEYRRNRERGAATDEEWQW